jgi:hypothetical protein
MPTHTQLSVFLENRPGTLANVLASLSQRKVNVLGISVVAGVDHAVVRMVVDRPQSALHVLGERGVLAVESDVIGISLPNSPGALAKVAERLSKAKVNIEYAYGSSPSGARQAYLFLRTSDPKKAAKLLG